MHIAFVVDVTGKAVTLLTIPCKKKRTSERLITPRLPFLSDGGRMDDS